ncbi:MAG: serine/threonine-protein kinase [Armatimonadota bacterium]|nr:protein kinase [bacterium]
MSTSSTNTLGKYQIIREIARSNDIVYEALDPSINRRIALKELSIPANLNGAQRRERIERFLREGRAAGRLTHPNIVTIYEVGKDGERYFIAMEYLEGQTLRDMLQAGGMLSIRDAVNYIMQLCSALSYAHANGIIHRDIKPDNVQILPGGLVKLTDFGIARLMGESSITQDGQVFGTPSYMSPEQVAGRKLDTRSDIFSVGVMLYEMITGRKPFTGDSVVTITYNIVNTEALPPPGAPPYLANIIRKAMAKDVDARYSSIDQMAEDLRDEKFNGVLPGSPVTLTSFSQPTNGAVQDPFGHPSTPITPYGTSLPSQNAGASTSNASDPFGQSAPAPAPVSITPPPSPDPVLDSETRNFLGVFLIVIALVGMLVFAVWAVNMAYSSYRVSLTSETAAKYLQQGNKLYSEGKVDEAIEQWQMAVSSSPDSKPGESAKKRIFDVSVAQARQYYDSRSASALQDTAASLIDADSHRPEGHFYMAAAAHMSGSMDVAKKEYEATVRFGGADAYGQAARRNLGPIYLSEGDTLAASGQKEQAAAAYEKAQRYGDADAMQIARDRLNSIR